MSTLLDQIEQQLSESAQAQQQYERELLEELRLTIAESVLGEAEPDPSRITEILRYLKKDHKWFSQAIANCKARHEGLQAEKLLPKLVAQASEIQAEINAHSPEIDQLEQKSKLRWLQQSNPDGRRIYKLPIREDITAEEFRELRELDFRINNLKDTQYLRHCKLQKTYDQQLEAQALIREGREARDQDLLKLPAPMDFRWPDEK